MSICSQLSIVFLIVLISCREAVEPNSVVIVPESIEAKDLSITHAKLWFETKFNKANARSNEENPRTLLWDKSYLNGFAFGEGVVVPISYQKNLSVSFSKDKKKATPKATMPINSLNYLIIYKNDENKFVEEVVNLIPEEDYLIKSNFRKKKINYEGYAVIKDWEGKIKKGFYYEDGIAKESLVDSKNKRTLLLNCVEFFYYDCPSGNLSPTGQVLDYQGCVFLYSETVCSDPNGPNNNGGGSYGYPGGGSGGGVTYEQLSQDPQFAAFIETLTAAEILWFITNPLKMASAKENKLKAETYVTQKYVDGNGDNHNANAFKHAIWSGLNRRSWGPEAAYELGLAHETDDGGSYNQHTMDLWNNALGIRLALDAPSEAGLIGAILGAIANGEGKRLENGEINGAVIPTDGTGRQP